MSKQLSLVTLAGRLIGVSSGIAQASERKPRKAIPWRVSWALRRLTFALASTIATMIVAMALLTSPASVMPAAAQGNGGGWCTPLGAGKGGCYPSPLAACAAQFEYYAPSQAFEGISDTPYWYSKNCNWSVHFGVIQPAGTTFQCPSGYTRVAANLGSCVLTNENMQERPQTNQCTGINNGASQNPQTGFPIDILTGSKFFRVTDFSTANGSLKLERFYESIAYGGQTFIMTKLPYQIGGGWRFSFQNELQFDTSGWLNGGYYLELETAKGGSFGFTYNRVYGNFSPYQPDYSTAQTDYSLQLVGTWPSNPATMMSESTQWTVHDPEDRVWLFQTFLNPLSGYYDVAYPISVTFRGGLTWTFAYGSSNQVTSVTDSYGNTISFNWTIYNPSTNGASGPPVPIGITSASLPDGTSIAYMSQSVYSMSGFSQPTADILTQVQHLDSSNNVIDSTSYLFENSSFPTFITGIVDAAGNRRWTVQYDSNGRATLSEEPSGALATSIAYTNAGYPSFTRTVTNALGKSAVYNYAWAYGDVHMQSIDGLASTNCPASAKPYSVSNGFVTSTTDEEGRVTNYSRNGQGLPTQIIDGYGTPNARTTSITWSPTYLVPTEVDQPNLKTDFTWNSSGQLTQVTQTDETSQSVPYSTHGQTRTWSYTYDTYGHLLTATGPLGGTETITYTYNASGFLSSITNELGQVLTISSVDARGQPTVIVDPNGVSTDLAYDLLGRLTTVTVNPGANQAVTSISYDVVGDITQITRPNGDYLQYSWNNAQRLTAITDNLGNSIQYTRDNLGNVTARSIEDPNNTLDLSQTATYDQLGRLLAFVGSATQTWTYAYDLTDNLISVTDPRSDIYQWAFDSLDRLISETNQDSSTVNLTRDGQDRITAYSDPRSLTTSYIRDGFGDVIQRTSPDTGTTVHTYNALGKPTQITDGRGVVTNLSYDNAGRLLTKQYPADPSENIAYTWDSTAGGNDGVGRLTQITDASGSINWTYDAFGRITQELKITAGIAYTIGYAYDLENNITQITYPSGRIATYSRDALGRITGVTTQQNASSAAVTLASGVTHMPFGPLNSLNYGNGLALTKTFTQDYLISTLVVQNASTSNVVVSRSYTFGDSINVTGIADNVNPARSEAYVYTPSNRLQQGGGIWGTLNWSYDGVGNRTSEALTSGYSNAYNYAASNNQLASLTQGGTTIRSFSYDGAGNLITDSNGSTTYNYAYNNRGRLATLTIGSTQTSSYFYDGLDRLAIDASPNLPLSGITQYVYDQAGHLLAESDDSGNTLTEYVWLDDMPIALVANVNTSPTLYFVHADHLDRPIRMTDGGENVVWDAVYNPFGGVNSITGSATNNLRFPGQYFLMEDGLHYNWHRHYDPTIGRYIQPDPLGFIDGPSLYNYAGASPLAAVDPKGLQIVNPLEATCIDPFQPGCWAGLGLGALGIYAAIQAQQGISTALSHANNCPTANDPCKELYAQIDAAVSELQERYYELLENKLGLPATGRMSVGGHQTQFVGWQNRLRNLLNQANTKGCLGYRTDAWYWATVPTPSPL
jgi:RHS repeat-associated protein